MGEKLVVSLEAINLKDGAKINVINDYIGSIIKNSKGYYEEEILINFIDYIPHNGVIYDIGANIGNHTLFFSKYLKPNRIVSFEPSKKLFDVLSENVRINKIDNVQLINSAVGEKEEKGILNFNTANSGASNMEVNSDGDVQIIKVDDLGFESPDFIKMDVEGFELHALKGMEKVLTKNGPTLWVEIQPENYYDVDSYLCDLGYVQIDRWLDNYIYTKPINEVSYRQIFNQIKSKPLQRFNSKITEINLKYRNVTEQIKNFQSKIKTVEGDYLTEKNKNQVLEREINDLKLTVPYLKEQVEFYKSIDIKDRESLERNYEKSQSYLEMKIAELNSEKTFLLKSIEELKLKLNKSEEYMQQYFQVLANLETLKTKNDFIQKENNSLKEQVNTNASLVNKIKELEPLIAQKETQIKEMTELQGNIIEDLNEKLLKENRVVKEQANQINLLEEKLMELEESVFEKEAQISESHQKKESLNEKVVNLLNELKEKEDCLKEVVTENNQKIQKIGSLEKSNQDLNRKLVDLQEKLNNMTNENIKYQADLQQNVKTINQLEREKEQFIAETVDLKSELENEIIEKIRLVNREELFAMKIENQLVEYKQREKEKGYLNNKINKLEKQLTNITKKYNALSNSKLGKLTSKYWKIRKQMIRGK